MKPCEERTVDVRGTRTTNALTLSPLTLVFPPRAAQCQPWKDDPPRASVRIAQRSATTVTFAASAPQAQAFRFESTGGDLTQGSATDLVVTAMSMQRDDLFEGHLNVTFRAAAPSTFAADRTVQLFHREVGSCPTPP